MKNMVMSSTHSNNKFDNAPAWAWAYFETFFYHFVKTGTFLDNLQYALLDEGLSIKVWKNGLLNPSEFLNKWNL